MCVVRVATTGISDVPCRCVDRGPVALVRIACIARSGIGSVPVLRIQSRVFCTRISRSPRVATVTAAVQRRASIDHDRMVGDAEDRVAAAEDEGGEESQCGGSHHQVPFS